MYCVKLYRNGKQLDEQLFDSAEDALRNMLIMITAAAFSCDDIPNLKVDFFECEKNEKTMVQEIRENCVMTNIIVTGNEKPYYLIEYYDKRDNQVYLGFGSKKFETVKAYQKEYFDNCKDDN